MHNETLGRFIIHEAVANKDPLKELTLNNETNIMW